MSKSIAEVRRSLQLTYAMDRKFDKFVQLQDRVTVNSGLGGGKVDDADVEKLIEAWNEFLEEEQFMKDEEARIAREAKALPITSSNGFEGYRITYYGGYISGDEAIVLSDSMFGSGFSKDKINDAIKRIRVVAIDELKVAAVQAGCNAIIGLDFDYVTIDRQIPAVGRPVNETYLILTANGTAVTIEPNVA